MAQLGDKLLEPVLKSNEKKTKAGGKGGSREEGGRGKEQQGSRDPLMVSKDAGKPFETESILLHCWILV